VYNDYQRRTSQGGYPPSDSDKTVIFRAKVKLFGQKPATKNEKKIFFLYFLNEKTEFILSSEIKCPKFGISTNNNTGWGESSKVILQVSIAVLSGTVEKIFWTKMAQPPRKNWPVRLRRL